MGTATLNLAKYANSDKEKELQIKVPLTVSGDAIEGDPYLCVSPSLKILALDLLVH